MQNHQNSKHLVPRDNMLEFAFGGNAHFTILNTHTGEHRVYHVKRKQKGSNVMDVRQEIGYDAYQSLGTLVEIQPGVMYRYIEDMPVSIEHVDRLKAFRYLSILLQAHRMNPIAEMYHHGTCGVCGRRLTDLESIDLGIGPYCRGKK